MKRVLKLVAKASVSILLLAFVIHSAGPSRIWDVLVQADPALYLVAVILSIGNTFLSAEKLKILLHAKGERLRFLAVLKYYYIGKFFNAFLPTNIGGDVVKAHKLSGDAEKSSEAYSSVFMERFTGLLALLGIAVVASLGFYGTFPRVVYLILYGVYIPGVLFLSFLLWGENIVKRFQHLYEPFLAKIPGIDVQGKLETFYTAIRAFRDRKRQVLYALVVSVVYHTLLVVTNILLAGAVGVDIPMYLFFAIIPISEVIVFLPISIGGLGVREATYTFFFTMLGATAAQAVSVSFLVQSLLLLATAIGGVVYVSSGAREELAGLS